MKPICILKPEDLNCNIFSCYDYDGLSLQELLCQFFTRLNECIDLSNETHDLAEWLVNEGLAQSVVKQLLIWKEDGTLAEVINEGVFENLNNKIKELTATKFYILKNKRTYGDCIVIQADDGTFSMIDCMYDDNLDSLQEGIKRLGIKKLKYLFITHDHSDHIGNAPYVIEHLRPDYIVYKDNISFERLPNEVEWQTRQYHDKMIAAADKYGVEKIVATNIEYKIGKDDVIKAFNADYYPYEHNNLNEFSISFLLKSKGTKSLFPGDSGYNAELRLTDTIGKLDFLKPSHDGNESGNKYSFIDVVQPQFVGTHLVSHHFPITNNLKKFLKYNAKLYSTENNAIVAFGIMNGTMMPMCKEYSMPLTFIDLDDGDYLLTNSEGRLASQGVYSYKTDWYFVKDMKGKMAKSEWIDYQGEQFYATSSGALARNTFIASSDQEDTWYWLGNDCRLPKGTKRWIDYHNNSYIADGQGKVYVDTWIEYEGANYYAGNGGVLYKNRFCEGQDGFYFLGPDGRMLEHGRNMITFKNDKYIFESNGLMMKNMIEYEGQWYYGHHESGNLLRNFWKQEDDGNWYYFDYDYKMVKSGDKFIDGKWYRFNEKGVCQNPSGAASKEELS